jgi:phage terminase large subunit-like protein
MESKIDISTDRATEYAKNVLKKKGPGKIIAGHSVIDACSRHINDIKQSKERHIRWDAAESEKAIGYFVEVLTLSGGEFEGLPFNPFPWECFIIGSLFGWKNADDGYRRFRVGYIETAKGSGKSPLLAGIGLRMLTSDSEPRAEVYAAATKRDQALILFRDAVAMVNNSIELDSRLKVHGAKGNEWNISFLQTGSFFRPISSEDRGVGQSGTRPHCGLLDEIHEHPTNAMVEFLRAGTKQRRQALILMITNSGYDRKSPCYGYHDYAMKVSAGQSQDDSFFGYVCTMDEGDDPFKSEECWIKTNPSLPITPGLKYLREQVREAKGMPSKESIVRRLNFCEWVDAAEPWIARDRWMAAIKELELPKKLLPCAAGIDLSGKLDLTALTLVFDNQDGTNSAFSWCWTPKEGLGERENRDRTPYSQWVNEGHLIAVEGRTIDYAYVAHFIKELHENHNINVLAFDRWRIDDLLRELNEINVECYLAKIETDDNGMDSIVCAEGYGTGMALLPHGQGFKDMSPAVDDLESAILNETLFINRNPVTTMCAANAVLQSDPAGNRKFAKNKSTGRIDNMISLCMANRIIRLVPTINVGTIYDKEDLLFV